MEEPFVARDENGSDENVGKSLRHFLLENSPNYIQAVPVHWLEQEQPSPDVQFYIALAFLVICIPGNISQLLVIIVYTR